MQLDMMNAPVDTNQLLGTVVTVRASMLIQGFRCWLCPVPKTDKAFYSSAIVLKRPGLVCELFSTPGTNHRVGGPGIPFGIDEVIVTGTLSKSPFPEFVAMLTDITSVIVIGYQGKEISIDLTDIDKPRDRELKDCVGLSMEEKAQWTGEIIRRRKLW